LAQLDAPLPLAASVRSGPLALFRHDSPVERTGFELFEPTIAAHNVRFLKTTGDGFLVEFANVVDALRCGVEVQREMAERNV
jgi:hypothetical protein